MAEKYYGLCESCEHDETCTLRRSAQLEIIQCEEFSTQPALARPVPEWNSQTVIDQSEIDRLGICANCLNLVTCGFPGARNRVQQCEEYVLDEAGVVLPVRSSKASKSAA